MTAVFKIDTSEIFCSHCTPLRQGITDTAYVLFPNDFPTDRSKNGTFSVHFRTFRRHRNGRARRSLSKVCPTGTRRNFVIPCLFLTTPKLLRAFDRPSRSPTIQKSKGTKSPVKVTKCAVCFGFCNKSCGLLGFINGSVGCKSKGDVVK